MAREQNREQNDCLRREDRILWDRVRSTAIPLKESERMNGEIKSAPPLFSMQLAKQIKQQNVDNASPTTANGKQLPLHLSPFDKSTYRKISKGRLEIEGRVDLHGLYRDAAYLLLLNFLKSIAPRFGYYRKRTVAWQRRGFASACPALVGNVAISANSVVI